MAALMTLDRQATYTGPPGGVNYDRRWWILGVLGIAQVMVILDRTVVNIALPSAQHALHFSNALLRAVAADIPPTNTRVV
jgi:hypothetical protein